MTVEPSPAPLSSAPLFPAPLFPAPLFPVNLSLAGRPVLVVGGGIVAARKVAQLRVCGAAVTVVAPEVCPELRASDEIRIERRRYRRGEVAAYRLVITATDRPEVNQAVHDDAEAAGVWVNAADDPARCTFTLPAVHRQGEVLLTASTGGRSPALASWLRGWLERCVGPEYGEVAARLAVRRARLHDSGTSTEGNDWRPIIEEELDAVRSERRAS